MTPEKRFPITCGNAFRAAFASVDILPGDLRRLGRLGVNILLPQDVHSPLTARLAMFEANGSRLAVCAADLNVMLTPAAAELRGAVARGGDLPPENVLFCWTHTHNAPSVWPWLPADPGFEYLDFVVARVEKLATEAAASLQPCRLSAARTEAPGISVNRRPLYRQADGRLQVGTHGPRGGADFAGMEGPDESALLVLRAEDFAGHTLGGLVNFAMHPTCTYSVPRFSTDYPGALRQTVEAAHGGTWLYLNGPAGNLTPANSIPGQPQAGGTERAERIGAVLADHVSRALEKAMPVAETGLAVQTTTLRIPQRRISGDRVETARKFLEAGLRQERWSGLLSEQLYGYAYHFYHRGAAVDDWLAREVIGMWEWRRRTGVRELVEDVPMQAMRLGHVGLAAFPCELFNEFSPELRAASPFPHTLLAQMANGWHGYLPPETAFAHGGYECCFAMQSRLAENAGRRLADTAAELLRRLGGPAAD